MDWYQTRKRTYVPGHVKKLLARLNENEGKSIKDIKAVPAFENFNGEGKHARVGHKHILTAADKCDKLVNDTTKINLALIPEKEWSKLDEIEQIMFGLSLNPEDPVLAESNDKFDWADLIAKRNEQYGHRVDHQSNKDMLLKLGKVPTTENKTIFKEAQKIIDKREASEKGQIVNDYKEEKILVALLNQAKKDMELKAPKRKVLIFPSERHKAIRRTIAEQLAANQNSIETYILLVWHSLEKDKDAWPDREVAIRKMFNYYKKIIKKAENENRRLEVVMCPYSRENDPHRDTTGDVKIGII